jgi:hypothetical protein
MLDPIKRETKGRKRERIMLQVTSSVIVELPVLTSDGHIVDCLVAALSISIGVGGIISYISLYIQSAYILTGYSSVHPAFLSCS